MKGCEGGIVGLLGARRGSRRPRPVIALALGIVVLVAGYFIFEAFIYPLLGQAIPFFAVTDLKAAFAEIIPNLFQGIISAVIAFGICRIFQTQE